MHKPNGDHPDRKYYIGVAGALRYGRTSADSVSVDRVKTKLLKEVPA